MEPIVPKQINVFIIYAREDKEIKHRLLSHLNPLKEAFDLNIWHDDYIEAGQEWKPHIESRLEQTDVFLLLVSVDFMNSEFIHQIEFKFAIDRHKANKSIVIPVIINYCQWDINIKFKDYSFNLSELQVLPEEAKPIGDWKTPEQAYNNIAAGIRRVLDKIKKSPVSGPTGITNAQKEKLFWENAVMSNTLPAYKKYLEVYEHGKFEQEALEKIRELTKKSPRLTFKSGIFILIALVSVIIGFILFKPVTHVAINPNTDYRAFCSKRLDTPDVEGKSAKELEIIRNTIYAMHGYIFRKNQRMIDYFNHQTWYQPRIDFNPKTDFSKTDSLNIALIQWFENKASKK